MNDKPDITINTNAFETIEDAEAPLLERVGHQIGRARLTLEENGVCHLIVSAIWDHGTPACEWHGRTRRWYLPALVTSEALSKLLNSRQTLQLLQRVHDGREIVWDANNLVGRLNEDAQEASNELERLFASLEERCWELFPAEELIEHYALSSIWPAGKSLAEAARDIRAEAMYQGFYPGTQAEMEDALLQKLKALTEADEVFAPTAEHALALKAK